MTRYVTPLSRSLLYVLLYPCVLAAAHASPSTIPAPAVPASNMPAVASPDSFGQLFVPAIRYENGHARHYREQCSATLIADGAQATSRLLLTAWHCLEDHRDLSRPAVFQTADGETLPVRLVASGGAMHADWALLRLPRALPSPLRIVSGIQHTAGSLRMAGFPRRTSPRVLIQQSGCRVTGKDGADLRTDCVLQKGASGGATLTDSAIPVFVGVISRGDGVTQSIFVPVSRFYPRIRLFLNDNAARERRLTD